MKMIKDRMSKLKIYFLNGSLWRILCNKYKAQGVILAHGKESKLLSRRYKIYRKLLRYKSCISYETDEKNISEKIIWSLWLQGEENAPDVVKACLNSHRKINGYTSIVLTEQTIDKYVSIPQYIWDKYKKGMISHAHFSDIVRVELLCRYGGIWCDATCYYSGGEEGLPEYIENSDLFVYKNIMNGVETITASNWLIKGNGNSAILQMVRRMLHEYWKKNSRCEHYYIFHFFFKMATEVFQSDWERVPSVNNVTPHELQMEMNKEFNQFRWEYLCNQSVFHKLTYVSEVKPNSYLEHIINYEGVK